VTSFRRNLVSNASSRAIGSVAQFVLILSLPHWMTVNVFASFLTAVAVVAIGEMASDFGSRIWAIKQFSASLSPKSVFLSALVAKGAFSSILAFIVLLLPFNLLSVEQVALILCIAVTQPSTDPLLWYLIGRERLDIEAGVQLVWRISNVLLITILAYEGVDLVGILFAWLSINITRIAVVWHLSFMNPIKKDCDGKDILSSGLSVVQLAFPVGLAFLLMSMYQRLGVLLLGEITDVHSVAIYGVAFTLIASAGFVATSITLSSFPLLAKAVANGDWPKVNQIVERKLMLIMIVFLPACIIGAMVSPWVISFFYPKEYSGVTLVMLALLPGLYISSINFALKYFMNALDLNWIDAFSATIGILVFSIFLIIPSWERVAVMAGWAWGLGEVSIFFVKWVAIMRDKNEANLNLARHLLIFLLLFGSAFFFNKDYGLWVKSFY